MFIAVMNNLPELILGLCWSVVTFRFGMKFARWRDRRDADSGNAPAKKWFGWLTGR